MGARRRAVAAFLLATIASGLALMMLEIVSTCAWLWMGKGVAVLLKLLLLSTVPFFWESRVAILLAVVVVASVGSHMSSRFRHYSLRRAIAGSHRRSRRGLAGTLGDVPPPNP